MLLLLWAHFGIESDTWDLEFPVGPRLELKTLDSLGRQIELDLDLLKVLHSQTLTNAPGVFLAVAVERDDSQSHAIDVMRDV